MPRADDLIKVLQGLRIVAGHAMESSAPVAAERLSQLTGHAVQVGGSLGHAVKKSAGCRPSMAAPHFEPPAPRPPPLTASDISLDIAPEAPVPPTLALQPEALTSRLGGAAVVTSLDERKALESAQSATSLPPPPSVPSTPSEQSMQPHLVQPPEPVQGKASVIQHSKRQEAAPPPSTEPLIKLKSPVVGLTPTPIAAAIGNLETEEKAQERSTAAAEKPSPEPPLQASLQAPVEGAFRGRTRAVPSTPLARVFGFGQLAAGLAIGTVAEAFRQGVGRGGSKSGAGGVREGKDAKEKVRQYMVSDANSERLAEALCRMRGAALKLGQMLSIQDEGMIPPQLAKALERVRAGADVMPSTQVYGQLERSFGPDWRSQLAHFEEEPMAAASIGQVHRARLLDGTDVAMKIQYPGVADSIESDLSNLERIVGITNILPPGLFIDQVVEVAREEMTLECDYELEAANQERFRGLIKSDPVLSEWMSVPKVVPALVSKQVLTTELVKGALTIDKVANLDQEVRNHVARLLLRVTVKELFEWRFMQTDPNWGNYLYDPATRILHLIDFGACRTYDSSFVDAYLKLVWAAAEKDEESLLQISKDLKFLTGDESAEMMRAHAGAGLVVGEPFTSDEPFDFNGSNLTARLGGHGEVFAKHRLTPPPREAYSLHRKLAGAFLACIKLRSVIPCRDILVETYKGHSFGR